MQISFLSTNRGASLIGLLVALLIVVFLVYFGTRIYYKSSTDAATKQMLKSEGIDTTNKSYIDHAKGAEDLMNQGIKKQDDALETIK